MNMAVRRLFMSNSFLRAIYRNARSKYHLRRIMTAAKNYFVNLDEYRDALEAEDGRIVDIHTRDGLTVSIRRNAMDAWVLAEIFLAKSYMQGLLLSNRPTVVDIGGYIGDFALYAARCLNAQKVVVCEPSPRNWTLLTKNVATNHYEDRIAMVNKAVTDGRDVLMDVDVSDRAQARVSAYYSSSSQRRVIPGISLADLVQDQGLSTIDLLKIDCEGGEYAILSSTPTGVFSRIQNIVFECHEIDGFQSKLEDVKQRLRGEGYSLRTRGSLISASRA